MAKAVDNALERYRIDEAAEILYQFVWHEFCDWYIEMVKVALEVKDGRDETYATLCNSFSRVLLILSPFVPFITEELRTAFPLSAGEKASPIALSEPETAIIQQVVIETVSKIRAVRGEMDIPPSQLMVVRVAPNEPLPLAALKTQPFDLTVFFPFIRRLARLQEIQIGPPPEQAAVISTGWGTVYLLLNRSQIQQEIVRLGKVLEKIEKERCNMENRMRVSDFVKAPQEIQEETRRRFE